MRSEPSPRGSASPPARILEVDDFGPDGTLALLDAARTLERESPRSPKHSGQVVGLCFFQPSTRTRAGFAAASARIGATPVTVTETKFQQGMEEPESVLDTVRCLAGYSDLVVLRHGDPRIISQVAALTSIPLVNAGNGTDQHPVQALIDLHAIREETGRLHGLRIGVAGDIANSRTARSLLRTLPWFSPAEILLMIPPDRALPPDTLAALPPSLVRTTDGLEAAGLDVLYMAGFPPGPGLNEVQQRQRDRLTLKRYHLDLLPPTATILCALPRTGDIDPGVDADPRAAYFRQSDRGLHVRMALLDAMLDPESAWPPRSAVPRLGSAVPVLPTMPR